MKLDKISRRRFLKGAGAAALAVAAAGMLAGCGSSGGSKVSPTETPTTKKVTVKYVLGKATGDEVGTDTINVDVTKLDVTNPTLSNTDLTLPKELAKKYYIAKGDYAIVKNGDVYEVYVTVEENATNSMVVTIEYVMATATDPNKTRPVTIPGAKTTLTVDSDAKTINTADLKIPMTSGYEAVHETEEIDGWCKATVLVKKG